MTDHARSIPILPSPDIGETVAFCTGQLAFGLVGPAMDNFAILCRGEIEIHFWLSDDCKLPDVSSCYIRGGEVPALYAEFSARNVPRLSDFTVRPWNMKEFYIHDPHGNLLRFGCNPEEA